MLSEEKVLALRDHEIAHLRETIASLGATHDRNGDEWTEWYREYNDKLKRKRIAKALDRIELLNVILEQRD